VSDLYGLLFRKALYPAWESGLRRRPTLSHVTELERSQWCSLDELQNLQSTELRRLLDHAYEHSPHYRTAFEGRSLRPSEVRTVEDLPKLPLLTRQAAAEGFQGQMSSEEPLPRIHKMTSGTTGRPLAFAYDVGSEYWRQAAKIRGYGWAGYRPGDRSLHFWGSTASVKAPMLRKRLKSAVDHLVRREHYVDCADHSGEALARVVRRLQRRRPDVILCYAQAGAALARHIVETKSRSWEDIAVISAAERLFPADRDVMTAAFGPGIFETYGSREVMLMAAECPAHEGLHVSMENLVIELVVRDGAQERPALPGELGDVVVTDLHNYGAPFIRYVTGDRAVASSPGRCACGRGLSRLQRVDGREADTVHDAHGRPVGGLIFPVLFSVFADKVRQFQVVQRKDRSIDVNVVPTSRFDDTLIETIRHNCEKSFPGVPFRMHVVSDIPVGPSGKSRVVIVEA
jgi:phenylacetate-CoA ligase